MQQISAVPYRGKTVKLEALVRSELPGEKDRAQLWMRVDRENREVGFFDNMDDRPIRDPEWKPYSIVGEIDPDARALNFGVFLVGEGKVWIDAVTIEIVGDENP